MNDAVLLSLTSDCDICGATIQIVFVADLL